MEPPRSFRDPDGYVVLQGDRVFRVVSADGLRSLRDFLASEVGKRLVADGKVVSTQFLDPTAAGSVLPAQPAGGAVVEHERVPFPSYPYEWSPGMLQDAGRLTLELARDLQPAGFGLKDATPYNVLFRGPRPVFVDVLSVERRAPRDPIWNAYGQFVRMFLLPLALDRVRHIPCADLLASRPDGVPPEEAFRMMGGLRSFVPPLAHLVGFPGLLSRSKRSHQASTYAPRASRSPEQAQFVYGAILRGLAKDLEKVGPAPSSSSWTGYMGGSSNADEQVACSYTDDQFAAKAAFVEAALKEVHPGSVLDIGCNTGHFSFAAARAGARVVAIDSDRAVVDAVWRRAREESLDVLPLVVDIARPSPAMGWENREHASFLERSGGAFDLVLALALIHHLLVSARIPVERILDLLSELTRDHALVEYVGPQDPMFQSLTRGRERLHEGFSKPAFETALAARFDVVRAQEYGGKDRALFLVRKRTASKGETGGLDAEWRAR